ncbi:MAG TPA: queuosine precursor transporter [Peptococcaceae bacterium]|nr:queuosine precursor transporter [Peptococcaceae bacterium]
MSNEIIFFIEFLLTFSLLLMAYKLFGKTGVYVWIVLSTVLANIQVTVTIGIFGMVATLGNIIYGSSFLATDILSEKYGIKEARRGVYIGFFANITTMVIMQLIIRYTPHSSDFMLEHVEQIFMFFPRIVVGSLAAFLFSQLHDTWAFEFWKRRFPRHLWLRSNFSTIVSQALDTVIFVTIAFGGVYDTEIVAGIALSTYLLKFIVAILDTPFMYLAARIENFVWGEK